MVRVRYVNIAFSLYSVFVVLVNVNPIATLKGLDSAKSLRHSGRKKETSVVDKAIEFALTEDEVLAESGVTVTLRCAVKNAENDIVSWIRRKNLRVITSGSIVFTTDSRFQLNYSTDSEFEWFNLTISNVQSNYSGIYECQVNTEPKLKRFVLLIVDSEYAGEELEHTSKVIPQDVPINLRAVTTNILGPPEQLVGAGDTVILTCYIGFKHSVDPVTNYTIGSPLQHHSESFFKKVHWFHSSSLLSVQLSDQNMNINTENYSPFLTISRLRILQVRSRDAGLYLCKPLGGPASKVILNVRRGEEIGAVKPENYLRFNNVRSGAVVGTAKYKQLFLLFYLVLFTGIHFPT